MNKTTLSGPKTVRESYAPKEALRRFVDAFEELVESLEYSSPTFWKEIETSRKSGRVSGASIKKALKL